VELREYWSIIWRRFWLVVIIVGIVVLYVGYQYYHLRKTSGALTQYSSNVTVQIGLLPSTNGIGTSSADDVSVSESLADALVTSPILSSKGFDTQVSNQIASDMSAIQQKYGANPSLGPWQDPGSIGSALSATRAHSLVTITATWSTPAGAWAISNAVGQVTTSNICSYLEYVVSKKASCSPSASSGLPAVASQLISPASDPGTVPGTSTNKVTLLVALVVVALVIALALVFLLDYLDDHIYSNDDAANLLELPVFAEIPPKPVPGRSRPHLPAA
jgi:capsular polysaccharide biosynthesis protein